jgi:predicted nucleic acid-binding protein
MIVVDASVIAHALAHDGDDGRSVRRRLLREDRLVAPDLLDVEVASVLRRRWLARDLTDHRLEQAIDDLEALPVDRLPMRMLVRRACELRANATPYDAVYVALAEAFGCVLLTADRRLAAAPGVRCEVEVIAA